MEPLLEVKGITKVFKKGKNDFVAVDNVSFDVMPGEILGIVGESGSGKSTVAKMITNLLDVTEGTILFEGREITNAKGIERKKLYRDIQMVFQTPTGSFDPRKTLGNGMGESLITQGYPKKMVNERVTGLLEKCGLPADFANRYPHQVSGGQCQRAAIARALANNPKLIICDEATSALDVTVQKQVLELLMGLKEETGVSYIFICHNLALVQQICDKVIVMYDGKVVESGTADEVIMNPKSEYTKTLLESCFD